MAQKRFSDFLSDIPVLLLGLFIYLNLMQKDTIRYDGLKIN